MNTDSFYMLFKLIAAYSVLCIFLPYFALAPVISGKKLSCRFFFCLLVSNIYLFNIVYLLGFLHIFNRITVVCFIILPAAAARIFLEYKRLKKFLAAKESVFYDIAAGNYGIRLFFHNIFLQVWGAMKKRLKKIRTAHILEALLFSGILIYGIYFFGYYKFHSFAYAAPDEEVHLYWVQSLIGGKIFPAGMYPFGLHAVMACISVIFGIPAVKVVLGFSNITLILIITALYLFLRKFIKCRYAALAGMAIFMVTGIFGQESYARYQFTLPMEYGIFALTAMFYFLILYIREKDKLYWWMFVLSLAITMASHFYVTIFGAFICLSIGLVYLLPIFKKKLLKGLIIGGILGLTISAVPFAVGYMLGYPFEQSMTWAIGVSKEQHKSISEDDIKEDGAEEKEAAADHTEKETELTADDAADGGEVSFCDKMIYGFLHYSIAEENYIILLAGLEMLLLLFGVFKLLRKKSREEGMFYLSMSILLFFAAFLTLTYIMGWPVLIEVKRASVFFAYYSTVLYCVPFELVYEFIAGRKGNGIRRTMAEAITILLGILAVYAHFYLGIEKKDRYFYRIQTDGAMKLCYDLIDHAEKNKWTVVSSVNELSIIQNDGYHYELLEFVKELDHYTEGLSIYIPTEKVYFIIEKYMVDFLSSNILNGRELPKRMPVSIEMAEVPIDYRNTENPSEIYQKQRCEIMSRAYYWAIAYKKYFPHEFSVYYEDEEVIIYELRQDTYALNNLAVNSGINGKKD